MNIIKVKSNAMNNNIFDLNTLLESLIVDDNMARQQQQARKSKVTFTKTEPRMNIGEFHWISCFIIFGSLFCSTMNSMLA